MAIFNKYSHREISKQPNIHPPTSRNQYPVSSLHPKLHIQTTARNLVTYFLLLPFCIYAQNLVPNGDFEKHRNILSFRSLKNLSHWTSANQCTPDYIKGTNSWKNISIPAHSGNNYVGLLISPAIDKKIYAEYIEVKLTQPLIKGRLYYLKFHCCLSKESNYTLTHLDYSITSKKLSDASKNRILPTSKYRPINSINDSALIATNRWMELASVYRAIGGERYLTIGLFNQRFNPEIDFIQTTKKNIITSMEKAVYRNTYYFLDDVTLIQLRDSQEYNRLIKKVITANKRPKTLGEKLDSMAVGEKSIAENIYFENNQWILLPKSESSLKELFTSMQKFPAMVVEISGHTNNIGNEEKNNDLSKRRAQAVAEYLIKNGINQNRLFIEGYGSNVPIESNETEAGRTQNERIEVNILYK